MGFRPRYPERARISLTSSIFAYPGPRKIFGETGIYAGAHAAVASRIFESPGAPSPSGDDRQRCARARKPGHYLPSPALTCRPFFFVPPAYRARFFKATHVLSMCDMPLKRHEGRGRHASTLRARIYAQPVPYINAYTRYPAKENEKERERDLQSHFLLADFLSKNMEPTIP